MGFLNKIKTSIGLKADEHLNQAKDNTNTNISLQDSQIIKNLDQTDQKPTTIDSQNIMTDNTPDITTKNLTDETIPQNTLEPELGDTNTTTDLNKEEIAAPFTEQNKEDTMTAIPETDTSVDNPAEKLKSIKEEKERISNQLEKLTAEIDSIIINLEKEFTEDKKTATDDKDTNKDDTKNKEEKPIKKVEDTKKTETDINTKQSTKKDTDENNKAKSKETAKDANVTEKDLKELEEFLSKEKIKKIPKK
ncbi:MAG: hypothetical protein KAI18_01215 [Candidatus Aenigmarchaeota archaeon]|nr:hypothetical protein [Candidatus Aenigmarchaeota archaeon]